MIQERIRQGVYVKDVAAELGIHPRTVSRALKRGGSAPGQRPAARKSKLDRYKPVIDRLLAAGVWNAAVILREIQEQDYSGQASILRDYIRPKRPLRQARRSRNGADRVVHQTQVRTSAGPARHLVRAGRQTRARLPGVLESGADDRVAGPAA